MSQSKQNNFHSSSQFQSDTSSILLNLQKKIQKYLSPSVYDSENIFEKSLDVKKNHQQIIQNNKQFIKKKQHTQFQKIIQKNGLNQFDQLLQRRKKCQAKLQKMLFDHQIQEDLRIQSPKKSKINEINPNDILKVQKKNKSIVKSHRITNNIPEQIQPNFGSIEKQLHTMQRKLQNLQKKVKSSTKKSKKSSFKSISQSKMQPFLSNRVSKALEPHKIVKSQVSRKLKSEIKIREKQNSLQVDRKKKKNVQNEEIKVEKGKKQDFDQTSLIKKFKSKQCQRNKVNQMNSSKLKKIGATRLNSNPFVHKNNLSNVYNKQKLKPIIERMCKCKGEERTKSKNHIKINLVHCKSEQLL